MDIDEMKDALSLLDRRYDAASPLDAPTLARRARSEVRRSLLPLGRGQIWRVAGGVAFLLLGAATWRDGRSAPMIASGVLLHLYGVLMIGFAMAARHKLALIDEAGPLVEVQSQLARLRRLMVVAGYVLGLSWWIVWLPAAAALIWVGAGIDLYTFVAAGWAVSCIAAGLAGYAGCWLVHLWAEKSGSKRLAERLGDLLTGRSLRAAERWLKDAASFAAE